MPRLSTQMPHKRLMITLCCLMLLLVTHTSLQAETLNTGDTAPNWMLRDTKGEAVLLYEEIDKKAVVVMFFWATWCQKCSDLLPELQKLAESSDPANTAFYALNLWEDKDPAEHLESLGITLPLLIKAESVAQRYGVGGTPSLIVVDADRKILLTQQAGEINNLHKQLSALLPTRTHSQ